MPAPAAPSPPSLRSHVTLALCTVLHAFTHAYGTILLPLYLLMESDLKLRGVWQASLVVTVYGLVYCATSYLAGILADRSDRKFLLGVGLVGNAVAIALVGVVRQYELVVALAVLAGLFGALFHPCANALVSAHYPKSPGLAIGFLGIGAGVGFFVGPQYAGWRAQAADWQRPLLEMGAVGLVAGIAFLFVAKEAEARVRIPWWRRRSSALFPQAGASSAPPRIAAEIGAEQQDIRGGAALAPAWTERSDPVHGATGNGQDRKSTRLNSSHLVISYAVVC